MKRYTLLAMAVFATHLAMAQQQVEVRITNLSPSGGTFLTPMWFGFHNGNFDMFSEGGAASAGVERIAEDGNAVALGTEFAASGQGSVAGLLNGIGPIAPGATTSRVVTLPNDPSSLYFSFMSMVIPSNDAFIGNDDARAHRLRNELGNWIGADFVVLGTGVLDAGTEVNDEIPINTAFLGQSSPNTGTPENGVVHRHPGFIAGGNILTNTQFRNADFTQPNYQVARITVTAVPEPASMIALGGAALALISRRRRK
jgi:hypothetical protein